MSEPARGSFLSWVAVAVAIGANPGFAGAAVITVWPDQFKIEAEGSRGVRTQQSPDALVGDGYYYAPVDVPVGVTVKFITVNYRKKAGAFYDWCAFLRRKSPAAPFEDIIDFRRPTEGPYPAGDGSLSSTAEHVKGPLTIEAGYRYYIQYEPLEGGALNSIQIVY